VLLEGRRKPPLGNGNKEGEKWQREDLSKKKKKIERLKLKRVLRATFGVSEKVYITTGRSTLQHHPQSNQSRPPKKTWEGGRLSISSQGGEEERGGGIPRAGEGNPAVIKLNSKGEKNDWGELRWKREGRLLLRGGSRLNNTSAQDPQRGEGEGPTSPENKGFNFGNRKAIRQIK